MKTQLSYNPTFMEVYERTHCTNRKLAPGSSTLHTDPPQFNYPKSAYYNDCIGAIDVDGTHVKVSVREHDQAKYIGRKGYATQNIMAVRDFNMCFTFAWAGWERTTHDIQILCEALRRTELKFPNPIGDKYYVHVGYPNTKCYLASYNGTNIRYPIPDFRCGQTAAIHAPKRAKEIFDYHHSSLRNVIERTFGVWKTKRYSCQSRL